MLPLTYPIGDFPRLLLGPLGLPAVPRPLPAVAGKALGQVMLADVKKRFQTGTSPDGRAWTPLAHPRPRGGGGKPLLDTGVLRNSIAARPEPDGASVGTVVPYASLHHFGGTIRPRRAKHLAIPVTREAARYDSPRQFPRPLRWVPSRRGGGKVKARLVEAVRKGRGKKQRTEVVTHYLLVDSVTIPARPFLGLSPDGLRAVDAIIAELAAKNWLAAPTARGLA